jgi:predicted permease
MLRDVRYACRMLLAVAVLNVGNLLLARLATRQREISIRLAIGATRGALARQLLIEALVLSGLAALASVPLTILLTRALVRVNLPFFVSRTLNLSPDWRVFAAAATICVTCGLLLGVTPAWRAWRADVRSGLASNGLSTRRTLFGAWDLRHALAIAQVAICLTLTLAAGLLGKSLIGLTRENLGFQPDRVTLFDIETYIRNYSKAQTADFNQNLLARVRRLPGVEAASLAFIALPSPMLATKTIAVLGAAGLAARFNVVSSGYFETMRMPMLAGRAFDDRDTNIESASTAIVSETAARRLWGEPARAIGEYIHVTDERNRSIDRQIVGVVRDAVYSEPDEAPRPYLFEPLDRTWEGAATLHVLGPREPDELIAQVKRELRLIDRSLAISEVTTLREHVATRIAAPSLAARLSIAASAVTVALAMLGLYASLAHLVAQRRTELAIRMSIGAAPRQILEFVAGFGLKIALAGTALGLAGSVVTMRLVATQLRGVDVRDPLVYAVVIALVLLAALAACLLPARHAARLDPWAILRR